MDFWLVSNVAAFYYRLDFHQYIAFELSERTPHANIMVITDCIILNVTMFFHLHSISSGVNYIFVTLFLDANKKW